MAHRGSHAIRRRGSYRCVRSRTSHRSRFHRRSAGLEGSCGAQRAQGCRSCVRVCDPDTGQDRDARIAYPSTFLRWIRFSIDVFAELLDRPGVALLNEPSGDVPVHQTGYWLLECFPTSTWRTSGLNALPGHRRAPADVVEEFARRLVEVYSLPAGAITRNHDHLQAVVAALPAVGLLGGPAHAHARGEPARSMDGILVEGLIWDAAPVDGTLPALFPRRVVEGVP